MSFGERQDMSTAEEAAEGLHPGAGNSPRKASPGNGHCYLIIQRDGNGAPKLHHCDDAREVQIFLETLLSDGVAREEIELFNASRLPFNVSYRPTVDFEAP